jgi:hypothetical protein
MSWVNLLQVIGVVGSCMSFVGVLIAIHQIRKTRSAAEAAAGSAQAAHAALTKSVALSDLTACATTIEEVKVHVRHGHHEPALLRVTDLSKSIVQLHEARKSDPLSANSNKRMLVQLGILRDLLERGVQGDETVNPIQVNKALSQIADSLNELVGRLKFQATGE